MVLIPAFLGERNVADEKGLPINSLATADNIDIDDSGIISGRDGFVLSMAFASITASFSTSDEQRLFIVDNGNLCIVYDDFTATVLQAGMPSTYIKWIEVVDNIVLNTGHIIDNENQVSLIRVEVPAQPSVTVGSGSLPAGQYQVTTTQTDDYGRESGVSLIVVIDVDDNSSLTVITDSNYQCNVYITDTDGEAFYLYGRGNAVIHETFALTYPIDKQQLDSGAMPDEIGSLAFYEGSIWCSKYENGVSFLFKSKPFYWHLFDIHEDYLSIQGKVTIIQGTPQGLIIGTDDEIYVYTIEESLVRLAEYGVIQGRPLAITDTGKYYLWTEQGVCSLFPFENVTESKLTLPSGCLCSTAMVEKNGYEQFVVLSDGSGEAFNPLGIVITIQEGAIMDLPAIKRGDTKTYNLTFKVKNTGDPIDISGDAFHFVVKQNKTDTDAQALINKRITFPANADSIAGIYTLTLTSEDTDVTIGNHYYGMQRVTDGTPPIVTTVGSGRVEVLQDIPVENG